MLGQPMFLPTPLVVGVRVRGALPRAPPRPTWSSRSRRCSASTGWSASSSSSSGTGARRSSSRIGRRSRTCVPSTVRPPRTGRWTRRPALPGADRPRRPRGPRRALHERAGAVPSRRRPRAGFTEILELDLAAIEAVGRRTQAAARPGPALTRVGFVRRAFRDRLEPDPDETDVGRLLEEGGKAEVAVDPDETVEPGTEERPAQPRRRPSRIRRDRRDHELHEHLEPRGDARRRPAGEEAVEAGLETKPWVKTSLAPGSRVVTEYLDAAGLTPYLDKLGSRSSVSGARRASGTPAAAGRGRGRRDRERPGRGRRPVGEPQLRGADPSARPSELPGIAAARGRLRSRRSRRGRPLEPAARRHGGRDRGVPARPVAVIRRGARGDRGVRLARAVRTRVRRGSSTGRALARAAHARGSRVRVGSGSTYVREPPFFSDLDPAPSEPVDIVGARCLVKVGTRSRPTISPAGAIRWNHRQVAT